MFDASPERRPSESVAREQQEHREKQIERDEELRWLPKDTGLVSFEFVKNYRWKLDAKGLFSETVLTADNWREALERMSSNDVRKRLEQLLDAGRSDPADLFDKLRGRELESLLLEHLDRFPVGSVDSRALYEILREPGALLGNPANVLKSLVMHGVEPNKLVEALVYTGREMYVFKYFDAFPEGGIDPQELVDRLVQKGRTNDIPAFLDLLPPGSVDVRPLVSKLWESDLGREAMWENIDKFPPGSVDVARLLQALELFPTFVLEHLHKAPPRSVDVEKIVADMAKDPYNAPTIAANLHDSLWGYVDAKKLADTLLRQRRETYILSRLDRFPPGSVDVKRMLSEMDPLIVIGHIDTIPPGLVDMIDLAKRLARSRGGVNEIDRRFAFLAKGRERELVEILMEKEELRWILLRHARELRAADVNFRLVAETAMETRYGLLLEHLDDLPEGVVDMHALAQVLWRKEAYQALAKHLNRFPPGAVDAVALANAMLSARHTRKTLARYMHQFPEGSVNVRALLTELVQGKTIKDLEPLRAFAIRDFTPQMLEQLAIPVESALAQHRFGLVRLWMMQQIRRHGRDVLQGMFENEAAQAVLKALRRDGRAREATDLEACMHLSGLDVPAAPEVAKAPEQARPEFETETIHVTDEMALFYLNSYIDSALRRIKRARDWNYRMDPMRVRDVQTLEQTKHLENQRLRHWMRWYTIEAVSSELHNQPEDGGEMSVPASRELYEQAPREEILEFFDHATGRFSRGWWRTSYGGASWARIARAGYALWASRGQTEVLVDHIFDLEHNTGMIFDKSPDRVRQDSTTMQKLLEMKRHEDFRVMLPKLHGLCSQEVIDKAYARLRILDRIERHVNV